MFVLQPEGTGGPVDGSLAMVFDTITGGKTAVIGSMLFIANASGCLTQVDSAWPSGTHVVNILESDRIALWQRGSICVGAGGVDACGPGVEPPVCTLGGPYRAQAGAAIRFDGTASYDPDGRIRSYAWQFGDGYSDRGATPTHAYQHAGRYTVTLCVTDDHSAEVCAETEVMVFAEPPPPDLPEPQLPPGALRFLGFEVASVNGEVRLAWRIAPESSEPRFTVWRRDPAELDFAALDDPDITRSGAEAGSLTCVDSDVLVGAKYVYRIELEDADTGARRRTAPLWVTIAPRIDTEPVLHPNQPNPFNPSTTIRFTVGDSDAVKLRIFDMNGRLVRTLVERRFETGTHAIEWDGRDDHGRTVSSGVYVYRLEAGASTHSRRMVLVR
jgi:PKD repeat protein